MTIGVYQITCNASGRKYIGSSCDIESRWRGHRADLDRKKHCNTHLQNAWNKHGEGSFQFKILEKCKLGQEKIREQHYNDYPVTGSNCRRRDVESTR